MLDFDTSACFFSGEVGKIAVINISTRWEVKV